MTDDPWLDDVDPFDELVDEDPDAEELEPDGVPDESLIRTFASHPTPTAAEMDEGYQLGAVIDTEDDEDSGVPE
jgi:hypothetical protein